MKTPVWQGFNPLNFPKHLRLDEDAFEEKGLVFVTSGVGMVQAWVGQFFTPITPS